MSGSIAAKSSSSAAGCRAAAASAAAAWAASVAAEHRVLLVGAEPNGERLDEGVAGHRADMGAWFRNGGFLGRGRPNPRFFKNCVIDLCCGLAMLGERRPYQMLRRALKEGRLSEVLEQIRRGDDPRRAWLAHLRYADLKRNPGGARANASEVASAAKDDLRFVRSLWLPRDGGTRPPTLTLVQGSAAQYAFVNVVWPALRARQEQGDSGRVVFVPHASARLAYATRLAMGQARRLATYPVPIATCPADSLRAFQVDGTWR